MPQNLISFIFGKLGADATLPSIRNPLPPYKQLTLGDLEEKSDVFAGAMRKFGVGTQLVKGQIPRIGVWGGEWAPCEFAVSVLGIIRAGGIPYLMPPAAPLTAPTPTSFPAVSMLVVHSNLLPHVPTSFPSTNIILLDLDPDNNSTGHIDVYECLESRTTRWTPGGDDGEEVEKGDGYEFLSEWGGKEGKVTSGEIIKMLGEWADRVRADARLRNEKPFSTSEGLAAFHAAIFHRKMLIMEHPVPEQKISNEGEEDVD